MNEIHQVRWEPALLEPLLQPLELWGLYYCVQGQARLLLTEQSLPLPAGYAAILPPGTPHALGCTQAGQCIGLLMRDPVLTVREPMAVADEAPFFLRSAFEAALYHFQTASAQRQSLLASYGSLISCYLSAYSALHPHTPVVDAILDQILANVGNSAYELDAFLRSLPFSYDYLRKLFQKETGVTPHQYLQEQRLQQAAELLLIRGGSIAETARLCGFREPLYFSRVFKKRFGVSPSRYGQSLTPGP